MDLVGNLTAIEKLTKARVKLNKRNPFFAYLVMKLDFQEVNEIETIGVDKYGNCIYNPKFIDILNDENMLYILAHEVLHCAFEHLIRVGSRDRETWNISADGVVNAILNGSGFKGFVVGGVNPNELKDKKGNLITDLHLKTAEEVYDLIFDGKNKGKGKGKGRVGKGGDGSADGVGIDVHIFDDTYKSKDMDKALEKSMSDGRYWKKKLSEAFAYGKMKGNVPLGMERQLEKLLDNTIDWRGKLYKYITTLIPIDYTWKFPHKKSYCLNTYLPNIAKEKLEVIIDLDSSGSISQKQLTEFLSEVVGITQQFNNVDLTIICNDTEVYNPKSYQNPTIRDVANYKVKGGGGTNHKPVFEWVRKNKPTAQLLVCFTDGYSTYPKPSEVRINTIWVLSEGNKKTIPFGEIVELKRRYE